MMSASAISAIIRAKKKKMEDEHSDAVKLSGIPEDATDEMVIKNHEAGEMLSENKPKDHDEDPSLEAQMAAEKKMDHHEETAPDSDDPYGKDGMQARKDRLRKSMMMKMGK